MDATTTTDVMTVELEATATPDSETVSKLRTGSGIEEMTVEGSRIVVEYQPYVVSREGVLNRMEDAGLVLRKEEEKEERKGFFRRFVDRIAAENKQSLGSGRLDCCDLNRGNRPQ